MMTPLMWYFETNFYTCLINICNDQLSNFPFSSLPYKCLHNSSHKVQNFKADKILLFEGHWPRRATKCMRKKAHRVVLLLKLRSEGIIQN